MGVALFRKFSDKKIAVLSCYNYQEMIMNGSVKVFKM